MKILIADIYPNVNHRLIKDTAGGYGTGNDFSSNFFLSFLNNFLGSMLSMPPMSAIYTYSILKRKGHDVDYIRTTKDAYVNDNYDVYIIPSSIIAFESELEFIKNIVNRGKTIFVIGVFSTVKSEDYDKKTVVVKGEPEKFFLENNLNEIINDEKILKEKANLNGKIEELDSLPFPYWSEYLKKYKLKNNFLDYNSLPAIPIQFSRGCPYSCFNYCTYPLQQGRKVRYRSIKNVVDEIENLNDLYGYKKFVFRDPVFSINRSKTIDLCDEIIRRNLKISFLIETHLNNLDEDLIKKLSKAGLKMVYVGIESSDDKVLDNMKRFSISSNKQYNLIKLLKDNGIITKSMFMLGNPDDSKKTISNTIKYAKFLPNELVQFSVFTPYPGTPIYDSYKTKITTNKMEDFNQYNLVFDHKYLKAKDINWLKLKAYYQVYLPKKFFVIIKCLVSFFR